MLLSQGTTLYAPVEKLSNDEVQRQALFFEKNDLLKQAFNSIQALVLVVNTYRQVVFANESFLTMLGMESVLPILGKRPGEAIQCIHAQDHEGGCGTSEACRYCNAINLVLQASSSRSNRAGEVVLTSDQNGLMLPLNLFENVTPLFIADEQFYVISFTDISDTKRRRFLERIFFHDIINTSGALRGLVSLLKEEVPAPLREEVEFVEDAFSGMLEDIMEQKQILEAENNEFKTEWLTLNSREIVNMVVRLYQKHDIAKDKEIRVSADCEAIVFKSDLVLLKRVLGNMLKNALEAESKGALISAGCRKVNEEQLEFWVHNPGVIQRPVQLQIFQRSFSTKGAGRGIGTYSMKLFGERFLGGKVGFTTNQTEGTTFWLRLNQTYRE